MLKFHEQSNSFYQTAIIVKTHCNLILIRLYTLSYLHFSNRKTASQPSVQKLYFCSQNHETCHCYRSKIRRARRFSVDLIQLDISLQMNEHLGSGEGSGTYTPAGKIEIWRLGSTLSLCMHSNHSISTFVQKHILIKRKTKGTFIG